MKRKKRAFHNGLQHLTQSLPYGQSIEITLPPPAAGVYEFTCPGRQYRGLLQVVP